MTRDEVQQVFDGMHEKIIEDSASPPRGRCSRFDVVTLAFTDLRDLSHSGDLRVSFINGILHSVWFYPDDYRSYVAALNESGVTLNSRGEFTPSANVRGWTYTAYDGRQYIAWEDTRLAKEIHDWIIACS